MGRLSENQGLKYADQLSKNMQEKEDTDKQQGLRGKREQSILSQGQEEKEAMEKTIYPSVGIPRQVSRIGPSDPREIWTVKQL